MSKIRIATLVGLERDGTCGEGVTAAGSAPVEPRSYTPPGNSLCNRYAWRCEAVVGRQQEERNSYQRLKTGQSVRNVGLPSESTHPDREEPPRRSILQWKTSVDERVLDRAHGSSSRERLERPRVTLMNRTKCQESSPIFHCLTLVRRALTTCAQRTEHWPRRKSYLVDCALQTWDHQRVTTVYVANRL